MGHEKAMDTSAIPEAVSTQRRPVATPCMGSNRPVRTMATPVAGAKKPSAEYSDNKKISSAEMETRQVKQKRLEVQSMLTANKRRMERIRGSANTDRDLEANIVEKPALAPRGAARGASPRQRVSAVGATMVEKPALSRRVATRAASPRQRISADATADCEKGSQKPRPQTAIGTFKERVPSTRRATPCSTPGQTSAADAAAVMP